MPKRKKTPTVSSSSSSSSLSTPRKTIRGNPYAKPSPSSSSSSPFRQNVHNTNEFDDVCLDDATLLAAVESAERKKRRTIAQKKRPQEKWTLHNATVKTPILATKQQQSTPHRNPYAPSISKRNATTTAAAAAISPTLKPINLSEVFSKSAAVASTTTKTTTTPITTTTGLTQLVQEQALMHESHERTRMCMLLMSMRRSLEKYLNNRFPLRTTTGATLVDRIHYLKRTGAIPSDLAANMDEIRSLGNQAAHRDAALPGRNEIEAAIRRFRQSKKDFEKEQQA